MLILSKAALHRTKPKLQHAASTFLGSGFCSRLQKKRTARASESKQLARTGNIQPQPNVTKNLTAGFKTARMASSKTDFKLFWLRAEHSTYFSAAKARDVTTKAVHARNARESKQTRRFNSPTFDLSSKRFALVLRQRGLALLRESAHLQHSITIAQTCTSQATSAVTRENAHNSTPP